ncbi:MAG: phosphoribosylglycinamide formyltransferase [Candidatus Xenolissoclinum pacificiensis L6]|uniref:Phosphoribosylglycinamide formyltransferase n=1 Tax=Candidatus Xenolissoclinum pacificiensis L6 TaxID=1401685 RepID=W2V0A8_9RICK|nr:MAG: phosphoribosylglycinamide formyltransferase [Candidatus Xenolissoclinum pacificiensis L6]
MFKIAILISGRGSNMESIIRRFHVDAYGLGIRVVCVISDVINAPGIRKARNYGVPSFVMPDIPSYTRLQNRFFFERRVTDILTSYGVRLVCLAGFMRILSKFFINLWNGRIINIHPSLLPAFKGLYAQKQALRSGAKITGCTVHYVDDKIDHGEIVAQRVVPIFPCDTLRSLANRINREELRLYPAVIEKIAKAMDTFSF